MSTFAKAIRETFLGRYLISELHCLECKLIPKLISDEQAVKRYFKKATGNDLDLENPRTFTEKTNWYKLNGHLPLMQQCADKYAVRVYVKEMGYANCLNEIYGVYDDVRAIDTNKLPEQFVLKATHGSHMNIVVKDKGAVRWRQARMLMRSWLRQDIYWSGREWVYRDIPRRIVAEKYLEDETGELSDYKIYCFNGQPYFMQYDTGRLSGHHCQDFYYMDLTPMPLECGCPHGNTAPPNIEVLGKMKNIAAALAKPFQFVRVDLYLVKNRIYFGELTFFDGGGNPSIHPEKYDLEIGDQWRLVK